MKKRFIPLHRMSKMVKKPGCCLKDGVYHEFICVCIKWNLNCYNCIFGSKMGLRYLTWARHLLFDFSVLYWFVIKIYDSFKNFLATNKS